MRLEQVTRLEAILEMQETADVLLELALGVGAPEKTIATLRTLIEEIEGMIEEEEEK